MKINVPSIPPEGQSIEFDQTTGWFAGLLQKGFREICPTGAPAHGRVQLLKTNQNVTCHGEVELRFSLVCSSCAKNFEWSMKVPLVRHMVPHFGLATKGDASEEEEIELTAEDLEFSFYRDEKIDLGELVAEEIQLALPMRFLCSEQCKGLCPRCGVNLNESSCPCAELPEGSPFAVLQQIKLKS